MKLKSIHIQAAGACALLAIGFLSASVFSVHAPSRESATDSPASASLRPHSRSTTDQQRENGRLSAHTQWGDLFDANINRWVANLMAFGMDADSIRAVVEARLGCDAGLSDATRLAAREELNAMLLKMAPSTTEFPVADLAFLEGDRKAIVGEALAGFDGRMRELRLAYASNAIEGGEYYEQWDALKKNRLDALLNTLTPEERRHWIQHESPEAQAFAELPCRIPKQQLGAVIEAQFAANQRLNSPDITDVERQQVQDELKEELMSLLGEEGYRRLERGQNPRYDAFANLDSSLGCSLETADLAFDWQRYAFEKDAELRRQGLSEPEVVAAMQAEIATARSALQQSMTSEQFQKFMEMPESVFLRSYEPLTEERASL